MKTSTLKRCSAAVVLGLMAALPGYLSLQVSEEGLKLITDFEGCQLQPYQCSAGVWTSGIGHTAGVKPAQAITEHQAAENLLLDIQQTERRIKKCMPVDMPQPVFDAVVSFAFNVGTGAACQSTLAFFINRQQWRNACEQLSRWVFVNGERNRGLERRRNAERSVCLKGA
ncbi:lysozyme [Rahnella sp. BIGb0236]|uniref:lysozyme n=1 Tax=Rahnella sp. BIGb0236 TaxID=2485117 RepID=UPI0010616A7A|nr:lysozyme [Rahnella sp. BIGb0236]TDS90534.1 lysozyme [Rahnella sp. BIGb0236]VTQ57506.1 Phage-related lysozyme (muraminidase) [Campylobacter jejuni]